ILVAIEAHVGARRRLRVAARIAALHGAHRIDRAGNGFLRNIGSMRIADRLTLHGAQPESLRGVVGRLLEPPIVEHQRLGLAVFEEQFAVVGAFQAAPQQRFGAALIEAGAGHQAERGIGHGPPHVFDNSPIYTQASAIAAARSKENLEAMMVTEAVPRPPDIVARLRRTFDAGRTRDLDWRRGQLEALRRLVLEGEPRLIAALQADFSKPAFETQVTETRNVAWEIDHALPRLGRWMRGQRAGVPWALWPGSARIMPEPLGLALIIAPWNYPVQLLLS